MRTNFTNIDHERELLYYSYIFVILANKDLQTKIYTCGLPGTNLDDVFIRKMKSSWDHLCTLILIPCTTYEVTDD